MHTRLTRRPPTLQASGQFAVPAPVQKLLKSVNGRRAIVTVGSQQRLSDLHQLIIESSIALAIMALISTGLGWLVAGRVLRPLRTMTAATQQISEANLNRRLALDGPRDELPRARRHDRWTARAPRGRVRCATAVRRQRLARASHAADRGAGDARDDPDRPPGRRSARSARPAGRCSRSPNSRSS